MNNNRGTSRRRGRGNNRPQPTGRSGGMDQGNRIDSRARGNATQMLEKYKKMAHDSQMNGDRVATEYYLQFADHYFRVLADNRARQDEYRRPREDQSREPSSDYADDDDDTGYNGGNSNGHGIYGSPQDSGDDHTSQGQNGNGHNDDGQDDDGEDTRGNSRNDNRSNDGRQNDNRSNDNRANDSRANDNRRERSPRDNRPEGRSAEGRNDNRAQNRNDNRGENRNDARNDPRPARPRPERAERPAPVQSHDSDRNAADRNEADRNDTGPAVAAPTSSEEQSPAPRLAVRGRGRPPRAVVASESNGLDPMILPPAIGIAPEAPAVDGEAPKPKRRAAPRRKAAEAGDVATATAEN